MHPECSYKQLDVEISRAKIVTLCYQHYDNDMMITVMNDFSFYVEYHNNNMIATIYKYVFKLLLKAKLKFFNYQLLVKKY